MPKCDLIIYFHKYLKKNTLKTKHLLYIKMHLKFVDIFVTQNKLTSRKNTWAIFVTPFKGNITLGPTYYENTTTSVYFPLMENS